MAYFRENQLNKDVGCVIHPTCATCPLDFCAKEYPGGITSFIADMQLMKMLRGGLDIKAAAQALNISQSQAEKRFARANKAFSGSAQKVPAY